MSSSKLLFNQKILTICFMILFVSCGSFNTSSFVSSDGLYSDESTIKSKIQSSYYKNYFQEKINEFEKNIYTDTISLSNYVNSSNISYTNSKPSWGDIPDKKTININYHDNFYFNRYLGYGYFHDFGFDHYYWHSPYYYYNWYPYYSYRYWGSRYYPYGYWRPYTYFPYRYNWSNYYGYYPYNYNNNQISINSGRRGSFSGSVEYNNRSSVPNNGNKNKVNYNNYRSNINLSNNMSARYYDRIIVRKDGSSTTERSYYSKYNPGPLKNEKNEFSTSSSNYNDYDKRNNSRNSDTRYYSKESSNWRLSGRSYNSQSTTNSNSPRSYSNPNSSRSSSNSNFNSNYSSRSSSSSITVPSSRSYSGNSSLSRTSSSSGSGRGSR